MKLIPLTGYNGKGYFAKVDDEFEHLSNFKWHAVFIKKSCGMAAIYARRYVYKDTYAYMHREVMKVVDKNIFIDHLNHDTLDNTLNNLVKSNILNNTRNPTPKGNTSCLYVIPKKKIPTWEKELPENSIALYLSSNQFTIIDKEDLQIVSKIKWYAEKQTTGNFYAVNRNKKTGKRIYLHRFLLNPPNGLFIDHVNRNPLDNRKSNLRFCTVLENSRNKASKRNSTSRYLGVAKTKIKWKSQSGEVKWYNYFVASIKFNGKCKHIGNFPNTLEGEILAAKRYDEYAKIHHGEFANLNFK